MTADREAEPIRVDIALGVVAALLASVEALFLTHPMVVESALLLASVHAGMVLAALLPERLLPARMRSSALWPLLPVVVAVLGPLGAGGIALAIAAQAVSSVRTTRFADWYEGLFPSAMDPAERLYEDLAFRGYRFSSSPDVVPLVDTARFGEVQIKQRLVVAVTERFDPNFARFLGAALSDAEPAIRVQAATAMAKLEHRFTEARRRLEAALATSQGDAAAALANLLVNFADSGLIDEIRARELRAEARRYGELAIASDGNALPAILATAKVCLSQGDHEDAIRILKPAIRSLSDNEDASLLYSTALFNGAWFGELHRHAQGLADRPIRSPRLREIVATWGAVAA